MKNLVRLLAIIITSFSFAQNPAVDVIRFDTNPTDPSSPVAGWMYMNNTHDLNVYNGTSWNKVGGESGVNVTDGTNTVTGVTDITFTGGVTVSGTTPSATINVAGGEASAIQYLTLTLTDHAITTSPVQILPSPGVDKVYDIVSMSISKNLTTAYSTDPAYHVFLGNGLIIPATGNDELRLNFIGIIIHKLTIVDYDGDAGDANTTADTVGNSALNLSFLTATTGGLGTIKVNVAYRILDL
ncbi:hypothetical protein [Aquimarina sp. Aq78]|uniref:hypothetical protein n=1 Tax=Aquimarina sp. Aq78 TaxID=1191889 RepID=UPI000D0FC52F|nr:hypothetical protein [Aquimarina sp. Aq78]